MSSHMRARDIGIPLEGKIGKYNAITDVEGVLVGHKTLIDGDGSLEIGKGPIRTGVTMVMPRGFTYDPVFAAYYSLNGNGEMTGTIWVEESGFLESAIGITNTHSVGIVRDAVVRFQHSQEGASEWALPVVAETYDGRLNDINGHHVTEKHVFEAIQSASTGIVLEGSVGGGTGMVCHGFKGGIGTSSRILDDGFTVGVLVQANYGARKHLTIAGVPVGIEIEGFESNFDGWLPPGTGSIIVIVATDAPLLPHQLKRMTRRVTMGMARLGSISEHSSGDIFLAFSTANPDAAKRKGIANLEMLANNAMDPLFEATIQATEEAILNALIAGKTMTGINGNVAYGLPHDQVQAILKKYNR